MVVQVPNSTLLKTKLQLGSGVLKAATSDLWNRDRFSERFISYMIVAHQIVRASVPLMRAAQDEARNKSSKLYSTFADYLEEHIIEEKDHDIWTLEDLEAIDVGASDVLEATPSANVASLVGAQYYWIYHRDPVCMLGYMAVLEDFNEVGVSIEQLRERTGFPEALFRTYKHHVVVDAAHSDDIYEILDRLPLSENQNELVGLSALHSMHMLAKCLDEITPHALPLSVAG